MKKITLVKIAMKRPSSDFVYAPSDKRPEKVVSDGDFLRNFSESGKVLVSRDQDGVSDPVETKTYSSNSLFGRFIKKG